MAQHHSKHVAGLRAEGHADANLPCALLHGVRHQPIDANNCQEQSNAGKDRKQRHVEFVACRGFRGYLIHGLNMRHRQSAACGAEFPAECPCSANRWTLVRTAQVMDHLRLRIAVMPSLN